jgi:Glycosyl hydrolases family 17
MRHYSPLRLLIITISIFFPHTLSTSLSTNSISPIGINYGQVADNLPPPASVLPLLHSLNVTHVKLYDTDPRVLSAFANTGIEFIVGLPDQLVPHLAQDPSVASSWVRSSILPHIPNTKITAITVGNEVLTGHDTTLIKSLVPAMESVQSALAASGLNGKIMVTTAHSLAVLEASFPPSGASFKKELVPYLSQLLCFHQKTGSPFLINAYPYFAYKADPKSLNLNYVLFEPNAGVVDSSSGLRYDNMLHAQVDAVRTAIKKVKL